VLPRDEFMLAGYEAFAAARDAARRDLLELEHKLELEYPYEEGKDYDLLMSEGDVAESILDCARERHIDLIVVGTHGRSGFTKALLGSVAERIFRHSEVPVLTIGPYARATAGFSPKRMLVPVDFTPASKVSAKYACQLAREHRSQLTLLHVIKPPQGESAADLECLKRGVEESLAEMVHCEARPSTVEVEAQFGSVVPCILNAAAEEKFDLMVLGVHTYPGLLNRLRWQVAYELVRQAPCPVLTVRENGAK